MIETEDENGKTAEASRKLAETSTSLAQDAIERGDEDEFVRLLGQAIWYNEYAERLENGYEE